MRGSTGGRDALIAALALGGLGVIIGLLRFFQDLPNPTIAALLLLLVILLTARTARLRTAFAVSVVAVAGFNFFLLPPFHTFELADPQNWVALVVFLIAATVASQLSAAARARAQEAVERQGELARLFDLSRDVLVMTASAQAMSRLAASIARRFDLESVAIALPAGDGWSIVQGGTKPLMVETTHVASAFAEAARAMEFDASARTYAGHRTVSADGRTARLVPLRVGVRPVGVLAAAGRPIEPGTLDALGGVVAIGIEHAQLLEERKEAELTRRSEQLKAALLASLGHDLRTPLTAVRLAANNLKAPWLAPEQRAEQSDLILAEAERLTQLFQNILDMARIDAGAVEIDVRLVHPSEIVTAAREQVEHALKGRTVHARIEPDEPVRVDPLLTATALARVLENAAHYSPADAAIEISVSGTSDGLLLQVRDHGAGIAAADLPHLFDRFYRGSAARPRTLGVGLGLSIARGLLGAEQGRIWAENCPDGGARFSILVPEVHTPVGAEAVS
jgi:two-component system sensor histidine kinase KdpD